MKLVAGRSLRDLLAERTTVDERIRLLSLLSSGAVQLADVNQDARDLAFSPDGRLLAIISADGVTWFHSLADGSWTYSRDMMRCRTSADFRAMAASFLVATISAQSYSEM
jgi:hypothetical protein